MITFNRRAWTTLLIAVLVAAIGPAHGSSIGDSGFAVCSEGNEPDNSTVASRVIDFAAGLAEFGPRPAATASERRALTTVVTQLEALGLHVTIEDFEYSTFAINTTSLDLGGESADPVILGLDPFNGRFTFTGEAVVVTDPAEASEALKGRIVVTDHPFMQLMIAAFDPAVVICIAPADLESFVARGDLEVALDVVGKPLVLQSANLVARFNSGDPTTPEILVTSHLDAYSNSPGANDNATGLGLMIELARAFASQANDSDVNITFVAFGAEENGVIGSRAFVRDHAEELPDVIAVVNLDTLGGALGPVIASKPSEPVVYPDGPGFHVPDGLRNRAWEGPGGRWRIIHPEIIPAAFTSNYPDWLHAIVTNSAADLGIEVTHLDLISDHRTFALAGVPAISIQSKEHHIHSVEDTADVLVQETIEECARIATGILCRLTEGRNREGAETAMSP